MGQEVTMGQEVEQEVTTGNQFPVTTVGKPDTFPETAEEKGGIQAEEVEKADKRRSWRNSRQK